MPKRSRRQIIVLLVAIACWLGVLTIIYLHPAPDDTARLLFFAVLGLAVAATALAVLPWMMADFIQDKVMLFIAGYFHGEADEKRRTERPLQLVR